MKSLQRMSVFRRADNANGYIQAVISSADVQCFYLLGFGPSVDAMPELEIEPPVVDTDTTDTTATVNIGATVSAPENESVADQGPAKNSRGRGGKSSADAGGSEE